MSALWQTARARARDADLGVAFRPSRDPEVRSASARPQAKDDLPAATQRSASAAEAR